MTEFLCNQCGNCCSNLEYLPIDSEDFARLKMAGREDLTTDSGAVEWEYSGGTGLIRAKNSKRCPFLIKAGKEEYYSCSIYDVRPNACRNFGVGTGREHSEKLSACPAWGGFKFIKNTEADQINHQMRMNRGS